MAMKPFGNDIRRHFGLGEAVEFRENFFMRKRLFETPAMHFNVYCIAPGQENPLHRHPDSDEVLYFVSGTGECTCGHRTYGVVPGDLVLVPRDVPHAIRNTAPSENMVCILAQAPPPCVRVPVPAKSTPA